MAVCYGSVPVLEEVDVILNEKASLKYTVDVYTAPAAEAPVAAVKPAAAAAPLSHLKGYVVGMDTKADAGAYGC